jgi:tetratricopeptide (TPR) repeat protein
MPPGDAARDVVAAHVNLGVALAARGHHADAIEHYRQALALHPELAEVHANLGNALRALGRSEEAIDAWRAAVALKPGLAKAHMSLGNALLALGRFDEAIPCYDAVLALAPDRTTAHVHRGNALEALGRYDEAVASYRRALALEPDLAEAHYNLANVLRTTGEIAQAFHHYDRALSINPGLVKASYNKGLLCLHTGRLAEGWELYGHRWAAQGLAPRPDHTHLPRWTGEPVRSLLVWGEQGLGDQILYAGLVTDLTERVATIGLAVERRLVALLTRSLPRVQVFALGGGLDFAWDAQAPVGDLGTYLRRNFADFPGRESYLLADRERATALRTRLARDGRRVIGLSWRRGRAKGAGMTGARLIDFASVLHLPGCRFIDLQYGDTTAEREFVCRETGVEIERVEEIDNTNDIDGLAALIAACDVVVTIGNVTAHLAGALGTATFAFIPFDRGWLWYWFKDRTDSPWYPRARVAHQARGQAWAELVAASCEDVAKAVGS